MHHIYEFVGQEQAYTRYRPNWNPLHAVDALRMAGIESPAGGWRAGGHEAPPTVVSIGAGNGADAAVFKRLGCNVILVEPNAELLNLAKMNLALIPEGEATFVHSDAIHTRVANGAADLIVVAQAAHTLRQAFAEKHLTPRERATGLGTEELARLHWMTLLKDCASARISIWYYNPDPRLEVTRVLHRLLIESCSAYRSSQTSLFHARYFQPAQLQPWVRAEQMKISSFYDEQTVTLAREQIGSWLSSYSFKPADEQMPPVVGMLQREWFERFQRDGRLDLPYVGVAVQGPLRATPFPMNEIEAPVELPAPLDVS